MAHDLRRLWFTALALAAIAGNPLPVRGQPSTLDGPSKDAPGRAAVAANLGDALAAECNSILAALNKGSKPTDLVQRAEVLLDLCIAYAQPQRDGPAIVQVASMYRLVKLLAEPKSVPAPARAALLGNLGLMRTLTLAMQPEDQPEQVLAMLARLQAERPALVADNAKLSGAIAAICLVYDGPQGHPTLGTTSVPIVDRSDSPSNSAGGRRNAEPIMSPVAPKIDPIAVLDHLASVRAKAVFALDQLPVELLVHVVNAKVTPEEQAWAAKTYPGNRSPGMLYDTINYDTPAFKYNAPKKIFKEPGGYTLANIKKVGGVCAEQALFASEVGKAIGVPSAFVYTRGATVAHAYVGYLKRQGQSMVWDFSEGRDGDYEDLRGTVRCPQTGTTLDTGTLGLTAIWASDSAADRDLTSAMTILALRAGELDGGGIEYPPAPPESMRASVPRSGHRAVTVKAQMDLLRAGLGKSWAYAPAWRIAMNAASAGVLDANERGVWMKAAMNQCARTAPDFAFAVAAAMLAPSLASEQSAPGGWDALAQQFNRRPDLVAAARFRQADAWEKADQPAKAWSGYKDVIARFPNDGTVIVEALGKAEQLLETHNKQDAVLNLYKDAFGRISKPKRLSTESMMQSNYFRVGSRYAQLLNEAGKKNDAEQVLRQIGMDDIARRNR